MAFFDGASDMIVKCVFVQLLDLQGNKQNLQAQETMHLLC